LINVFSILVYNVIHNNICNAVSVEWNIGEINDN